ncbi:hypothetical protein CCH79_00020590, partial [Gambusia affinis]
MRVVQVSRLFRLYGHVFYSDARNKDICIGDVGGAVVHNGKIYGVISFAHPYHGCQIPAAAMDVCEYLGWIKPITGIE